MWDTSMWLVNSTFIGLYNEDMANIYIYEIKTYYELIIRVFFLFNFSVVVLVVPVLLFFSITVVIAWLYLYIFI